MPNKICPLYKAATISNEKFLYDDGKIMNTERIECDGADCAWWDGRGNCAVECLVWLYGGSISK